MLSLLYLNHFSNSKKDFIIYDLVLLTGCKILRSKLLNQLFKWFSKLLFKAANRQEV